MTGPAAAPEVDVEDLVMAYLAPLIDAGVMAACAARMPQDPPLPFVLVQRVAGGDDYLWDHATVSVHSVAEHQTTASDVARRVHHRMRHLHPQEPADVNGQVAAITWISVQQTPMWVDFQDPVLRRYVARYEIDVRLPAIPGF
jgi:hypothetical protein